MKKQFLVAAILILAGICFSSINNSTLKACGTNVKACSAVNKKSVKKIQEEYIEDADAAFDMFMNPFIQL